MNLQKTEFQLEEIGLTKSEIKVYLALLEIGASTTGPIIDKSQTANSKIYSVLEKLINKGLVTFFKQKGLKYYKACNPTHLRRYLKEKEEKLKEQEKQVEEILPTLTALFSEQAKEQDASVHKGIKGARTAFRDIIEATGEKGVVNVMGAYDFTPEFTQLVTIFHRERKEKKVKGRFLVNQGSERIAEHFLNYPPAEVRFMEKGVRTPAVFLIYKNKVMISLTDELVFFTLTSQRAADSFNAYFESIWKKAEKYKKS